MPSTQKTAVLASGGLDSAILVSYLLDRGDEVQPIYVDSGTVWQPEELAGLKAYLAAISPVVRGSPDPAPSRLAELVVLKLPLADLYADHWSLTGQQTPDAQTPDDAVYLPGRNLLLAIKPAIWCQLHGISRLALGVLGSNPFDDATPEFFHALEDVLAHLGQPPIKIDRPFGAMHKREVMELGRNYPLGLTFSCIAPVNGRHCGKCNKCAERKTAFRMINLADPTQYAKPM